MPALEDHTDVLIVGSGIAGGIVADRLCAAGRSCVMVEAGRHFTAADFPLPSVAQGSLFWRQGMEFTNDGRMMVLRGKCVGGSSVVNQALLDIASDKTLERWARKSGASEVFGDTIMRRYEHLLEGKGFQHRVLPEAANTGNAKVFLRGMRKCGWKSRQLRRAQSDCGWDEGQNCIDCLSGCPRNSKQSALVTSLPRAKANGLVIFDRTQVLGITDTGAGARVTLMREGRKSVVNCNLAVLAAGSLGTTEILLRSGFKTQLRTLGENFHFHPTYYSFARFAEPVDGHIGAFQSVGSDEPRFDELGFKLECLALPMPVMAMVTPWSGTDQGKLVDYRHWACAEIAIHDTQPGRISVRGNRWRTITKGLSRRDRESRRCGRDIVDRLFRQAGAEEVVHGWLSLSVHPMGGCGISSRADGGVTRPDNCLHGSRNIFVCDSSLFPDALGRNPSLTVMALADMAADHLMDHKRVHHV